MNELSNQASAVVIGLKCSKIVIKINIKFTDSGYSHFHRLTETGQVIVESLPDRNGKQLHLMLAVLAFQQ